MSSRSSGSESTAMEDFEKEALLENGFDEPSFTIQLIESEGTAQHRRTSLKPQRKYSLLHLLKFPWLRSSRVAWLIATILAIVLLFTTGFIPRQGAGVLRYAALMPSTPSHSWQSVDNLFIL